ncbi:hypothetical protein KQR54_15065 [Mycobacterium gordonae]|uniref:hypothetical protein n=1 Tax=Mycobacterium gordonae TaxID=1778 RepID=UPI002108FF5D|nr:hypothetical protein [Mycobacterium gordonae]MCQ4362434.1 hypothetical protein [Mycobacterium gordonae]
MTVYICEACQEQVHPGTGYIHTTRNGRYWAVHHRDCADLSDAYCIAVPNHWSEFLSAHRDLSQRRKVAQ